MTCRVDRFKLVNARDPIIIGVSVTSGDFKLSDKMYVSSKDDILLGIVSRITSRDSYDNLDKAIEGQNVVVTIDAINGEAPKMYMRHFDHLDTLEALA